MNALATSPATKADMAPRPYFAALDGFRGLLALLVAMYHTIWLSHPNSSAFFNNGPVIIDLFFAFSGFLMFTLYSAHMQTKAHVKGFMIKRFARLYPLHLFMLLVFVAFAVFRLWAHKVGLAMHEAGEVLPFQAGAPESWRNLVAHLTLTHAMGGADALTYNPPSWTVGAEFYAYFLFVGFMLLRPNKAWNFLVVALGVAALYYYLSLRHANMDATYQDGFLRCVAGFFIGVIAAYVNNRPSVKTTFSNMGATAMSRLEIYTLLGSVAFVIYCGGKMQFFVGPILFMFVLIFAQDRGFVSRFMSHPVFRYLAKISYSVYMTHVIIAIFYAVLAERLVAGVIPNWNDTGVGGDLLMIPYLLTVIAVSHFTYYWVEVPGGRIINRFFKKTPPATKTVEPVPHA